MPLARAVWIGVAILLVTIAWGVVTVARGHVVVSTLAVPPPVAPITSWAPLDVALAILLGFALTLPVLGGGEALARAAHELPPPRVQALRRTGLLTVLFAGVTTTLGTFLALLLVPASEQPLWANAPLAGLAQHLAAPSAIRVLIAVALAGAAVLILGPAAHAAFGDTEQMLQRASTDGTLPSGLASLHTRFGTPARAVDVTVLAMVFVVLATGGRVAWLSRAYGIAIAVMLVLTIASLARLRRARQGAIPFKARGNVRSSGREIPLGLFAAGSVVAASASAMVLSGDVAAIATLALVALLSAWFTAAVRQAAPVEVRADESSFDLLLAAELSPDQIEARPGNVLVPVRNPHLLAHVVAALQTSGDRDVVVMTARMLDVDVSEESAGQATPTPYERRLLSDVVALAERVGRPGPAADRPDAQRRRRHRRHGHSPALVGRLRRRVVDAVRRGSGAPARRRLGAGRQARSARRPARHLSPQRPRRHLPPRRPSAVPDFRRSRSDSPAVARRGQDRRPARAP